MVLTGVWWLGTAIDVQPPFDDVISGAIMANPRGKPPPQSSRWRRICHGSLKKKKWKQGNNLSNAKTKVLASSSLSLGCRSLRSRDTARRPRPVDMRRRSDSTRHGPVRKWCSRYFQSNPGFFFFLKVIGGGRGVFRDVLKVTGVFRDDLVWWKGIRIWKESECKFSSGNHYILSSVFFLMLGDFSLEM